MPKDIIVNGVELCIKNENEYNEFREMLKENIHIDDLERWEANVSFLIYYYLK